MLPSEAGEGILWFAYLSSHPRTHFMNFMEIDDGMNQLYSPGHPSPNTITGLVNQVSCLCWYLCLINSFLIVVVQSLSCDSMDCNMPGSPVLHYLLELAQTHTH